MKSCVNVDTDGYIYITSDKPGASTCQYIISDSSLGFSDLTYEEGGQIAAAILAIWAVAWVCKVISRMVLTSGD